MADFFYSGQSCIDNSVIAVLSATTSYSVGDVVNVENVNFPIFDCFTITSEANSGDTVTFEINSGETSCISCIQNVGGVFVFSECSDPTSSVNINVNEFNTVPSFPQSYYLELTGSTGCYVFDGWDPSDVPNESISLILGPYEECNVCIVENTPVTANTIYESCVICDPCLSGGTATATAVPHPVWTGLYGNDVTQGNAVQLGGQNGLYS
jgi:hypothetical protein